MKPLVCLRALITIEWVTRLLILFPKRGQLSSFSWLPILVIALFVTGTVAMFAGKRVGIYAYVGAYLAALRCEGLFTSPKTVVETGCWFVFGAILYLAFTVLKSPGKRAF